MPRYRRSFRRPRRKMGNSVIHVPATIGGGVTNASATLVVIASPSIFAGGSASSNIEAQDKDRTVNVGHHMGTCTLDLSIRNTVADGVIEFVVSKVERHDTTPVLGSHPVPSIADLNTQGSQQAWRLANPGKVFHFSMRAYSIEQTLTHRIKVSCAKFKVSKWKAGDALILTLFNRGPNPVTFDFQGRYKEYE